MERIEATATPSIYPSSPTLDMDQLTVTQKLIIEQLVSRRRLGVTEWTFDREPALSRAINELHSQGWFTWTRTGDRTYEVRLSDDGFRAGSSPSYLTPLEKEHRALKARVAELEAKAAIWDDTPAYVEPPR